MNKISHCKTPPSIAIMEFTLNDINPHGEDLQIGVVDPAVIEDLYKRLNRDLVMNDGKRPKIDPELNVKDKVLYNYNEDNPYPHNDVYVEIDYPLFESLCGSVFTTLVGYGQYAELAITISDAIKYGIVKRTENPDVFKIRSDHVVDRHHIYPLCGVAILLYVYDGIELKYFTYDMGLHVDIRVGIIPDPVMIKNATKV